LTNNWVSSCFNFFNWIFKIVFNYFFSFIQFFLNNIFTIFN
jgi:hypothetical protein